MLPRRKAIQTKFHADNMPPRQNVTQSKRHTSKTPHGQIDTWKKCHPDRDPDKMSWLMRQDKKSHMAKMASGPDATNKMPHGYNATWTKCNTDKTQPEKNIIGKIILISIGKDGHTHIFKRNLQRAFSLYVFLNFARFEFKSFLKVFKRFMIIAKKIKYLFFSVWNEISLNF